MEPDASPFLTPRRVRWLVAALVGWSFLLRLAFASYGLHPGRFYDERYSLENLRAVLAPAPGVSGLDRLRPVNGWYPSLSHLPQVPVLAASRGLHRLTGEPRFAIFREGDPERGFTPTAYFLCRATVAGFGALTLVLAFLAGRRLFGPGTGLLGALILAASPAHLRHSAMFKPDMLLTLLTLTVFLLALRLTERSRDEPEGGTPERRRGWAAAGAAVGLAAASKLNGVLTAMLPMAVAAGRAIRDRSLQRTWRSLAGLAVSGATAAAVFLLLNPFVGLYAEYLGRNLRIYGERAELAGLDRADAFRAVAEHLLSPGFHGLWLGAAALAGCVALAGMAIRRRRFPTLLVPWWVFGYGAAYAASTAYPKPNNLLPLLPFTSLAAAWGVVWLLRVPGRFSLDALAARRPALGGRSVRRGLAAALIGVGAAALLVPLHVHAYRTAVPTTHELLERALTPELRPFAGRTVLVVQPEEREEIPVPVFLDRRSAVAVRVVGEGEVSSPEERRLADAVVFVGEESPDAESPAVRRFGPRWGRAWGPPLAVRLHPWERVEGARHWAEGLGTGEAGHRWSLPPPSLESAPTSGSPPQERLLSVQVLVRDPEPPPAAPRLEVGGRPVPLRATRVETGGYVYGTAFTSQRFAWRSGEELRVVFAPGPPAPRPPVADVLVWRPPDGLY